MTSWDVLNGVLRQAAARRVNGLQLRVLMGILLEGQWHADGWWAQEAAVRVFVRERKDHFDDGWEELVKDGIAFHHKTEPRLGLELDFSRWQRRFRRPENDDAGALNFGVDLLKARAAVSAEAASRAEGSTAPGEAISPGARDYRASEQLPASGAGNPTIKTFAHLRDSLDRLAAYDPVNDPIREAERLRLPENSGNNPENSGRSDFSRKIRGGGGPQCPPGEDAAPGKFGEPTLRNVYSSDVSTSKRNVTLRVLPENSGESECREAVKAFVGDRDYRLHWSRRTAEVWFTDHRNLLIDSYNYYVRLLRDEADFKFTKGPGAALYYEVQQRRNDMLKRAAGGGGSKPPHTMR